MIDVPDQPSLLEADKLKGNVQIAKRAAQRVYKLNPSGYEDAMEQRLLMKEKSTEKEPGCSSIELYGVLHKFRVGAGCTLRIELYGVLHKLALT
ncbi:hypothetical protein TSUD_252790 [Trifolium subterraneum]|nr:hypothetical protein TSUD_252790 [Trifolium subterraneum]